MPKITKKMLEQIDKKAKQYENLEDFDRDYVLDKLDEVEELSDENSIDIYAMAICLTRQDEDKSLDSKVSFKMIKLGFKPMQFMKLMQEEDKIGDIFEIDEDGEVSYAETIEDNNELYVNIGKDKNIVIDDDLTKDNGLENGRIELKENAISNRDETDVLIENISKKHLLSFKGSVEKAYADDKFNSAHSNFVLLDEDFFQELIDEDYEQIVNADNSNRVITVDEDLRGRFNNANSEVNGEDNLVGLEDGDTKTMRRASLKENLSIYLALRQRGENRGFFDVLFHPIDTYKEWKLRGEVKDSIKEQFGLTDKAFDKINEIVCKNGEVPEGFVVMNKNGNEILENSPENAKNDYFKDDLGLEYSEYYKKDTSGIVRELIQGGKNYQKEINPLINIARDTSSEIEDDQVSEISDRSSERDLDRSIDSNM